MKMTKQHTFETVPITNCKIVERGKMGSPNTHIHDPSHTVCGFPGYSVLSTTKSDRRCYIVYLFVYFVFVSLTSNFI
jgi:hypothetical protein